MTDSEVRELIDNTVSLGEVPAKFQGMTSRQLRLIADEMDKMDDLWERYGKLLLEEQ